MSDPYKQFFRKAQENRRKDQPKFKVRTQTPPTEEKLRQAVKVRRAKAPFPWRALVVLAITAGLGGYYLTSPDQVHDWLDKLEVSAVGEARAQAESSKAKAEKAAASTPAANPDKGPETNAQSSEDISHFEKLKQRKEELDMREKELVELEEELQKQKVELDKRIQQLEEMRGQIAQVLKERVEVDQEKVNKLVELYSNMKPKQAADVIGTINEDLAVEVLAKMKKKSAAEIMNLLPPEKARVLSEKYTGYRRNYGDSKG